MIKTYIFDDAPFHLGNLHLGDRSFDWGLK